MKRLLSATSIFAIAIALMFGMSACTQNGTTTPSDDIFSQALFMSAGDYVEPIQYSECQLDRDPMLLNEVTPERVQNGMLFGGKEPALPLGQILRQLKLTPEQLEQVKAIMLTHRDCQRTARIAFHEAIQGLLEEAAAARQEVRAKLDAGEITLEEARAQIKAINEKLRSDIQESGELEKLQAALKACNDTMIDAIRSILTDEQKDLFDKWLEFIKNRKGNGGRGGFGTGTGRP